MPQIKMKQSRYINGKLAEKGQVGDVSAKDARYLVNKGWADPVAEKGDEKADKKAAK